MFDSTNLYPIVERYASFGNHHTGTDADRATTSWLVGLLRGLGADVEEDPYTFDRFVCHADLTINGEAVPCVPLFYSATGEIIRRSSKGSEPTMGSSGTLTRLTKRCPLAETIAADHRYRRPGRPTGAMQSDTDPTTRTSAVVIAGNWLARVGQVGHDIEFDFSASLEPGKSSNVIAQLGDPAAPEVMITTPLTGWTPAAGERGTGLAVALALAASLAHDYRVVFSACSGHELDTSACATSCQLVN